MGGFITPVIVRLAVMATSMYRTCAIIAYRYFIMMVHSFGNGAVKAMMMVNFELQSACNVVTMGWSLCPIRTVIAYSVFVSMVHSFVNGAVRAMPMETYAILVAWQLIVE